MTAVIIIVALLALAGFPFWLAVTCGGFAEWVVAAGVLVFGVWGAAKVLS